MFDSVFYQKSLKEFRFAKALFDNHSESEGLSQRYHYLNDIYSFVFRWVRVQERRCADSVVSSPESTDRMVATCQPLGWTHRLSPRQQVVIISYPSVCWPQSYRKIESYSSADVWRHKWSPIDVQQLLCVVWHGFGSFADRWLDPTEKLERILAGTAKQLWHSHKSPKFWFK